MPKQNPQKSLRKKVSINKRVAKLGVWNEDVYSTDMIIDKVNEIIDVVNNLINPKKK